MRASVRKNLVTPERTGLLTEGRLLEFWRYSCRYGVLFNVILLDQRGQLDVTQVSVTQTKLSVFYRTTS